MTANRRIFVPIFLILTLPAVAATSSFGQAPVTNGLVNRWSGNGDAHDAMGHDDGKIAGGLRFGLGQKGQAFQFNSGDAAIDFGTNAGNFGARDFTVAFWMKTSSANQQEAFFDKRSTCDSVTAHWQIVIGGGEPARAGCINPGINEGQFQAYYGLVSTRALNDGIWHHVAWARQSSSSGNTTYLLYIDGKLDVTAERYAGGTLARDANFPPATNISNTAPLLLGQSVCQCCDGTKPYSGAAGELQMFNRALSAEEISTIYQATKSEK